MAPAEAEEESLSWSGSDVGDAVAEAAAPVLELDGEGFGLESEVVVSEVVVSEVVEEEVDDEVVLVLIVRSGGASRRVPTPPEVTQLRTW
jgi:hypothetical protein